MSDIGLVRELLRRAILTLSVLPDPDLRFRLGPRSCWPVFIQAMHDAYGAAPPKVRTFCPTPADQSNYLTVLSWLRWYGRQFPYRGPETVKLFTAWVFGTAMWQLQMRCTTNRRQPATPKTVNNRLNDMLIAIATRFRDDPLLRTLDQVPGFPYELINPEYVGNCVETDLRDLPTSPKACRSAISEPLSPKQEKRAHAALTKRFEHNRLAALRRQQRREPLLQAVG